MLKTYKSCKIRLPQDYGMRIIFQELTALCIVIHQGTYLKIPYERYFYSIKSSKTI